MCGKPDTPRLLVLAAPAVPSRTQRDGLAKGRDTHMSSTGRTGFFVAAGGRHRRQLMFSGRFLRSAPLRATVTAIAVVVAGLSRPVFPALAEGEPTGAVDSY